MTRTHEALAAWKCKGKEQDIDIREEVRAWAAAAAVAANLAPAARTDGAPLLPQQLAAPLQLYINEG